MRRAVVDGLICRHTIGYRAGLHSGEIGLLVEIQFGWDLRSVGVVMQGVLRSVGHGSDPNDWYSNVKEKGPGGWK